MILLPCRFMTNARERFPASALSRWKTRKPASKSKSTRQTAHFPGASGRKQTPMKRNSPGLSGETTSTGSRCGQGRIICPRCAGFSNNANDGWLFVSELSNEYRRRISRYCATGGLFFDPSVGGFRRRVHRTYHPWWDNLADRAFTKICPAIEVSAGACPRRTGANGERHRENAAISL